MPTLSQLQAQLAALEADRSQLVNSGEFLQHCWLVQLKPGGTARTDRQYWQVRSRQPLFDGKKLKHLKTAEEVEAYKAAIDRGRQIKQIDRQLQKIREQLQIHSATLPTHSVEEVEPVVNELNAAIEPETIAPKLTEQEELVQSVIATSQQLRNSLRQSLNRSQALEARSQQIRKSFASVVRRSHTKPID